MTAIQLLVTISVFETRIICKAHFRKVLNPWNFTRKKILNNFLYYLHHIGWPKSIRTVNKTKIGCGRLSFCDTSLKFQNQTSLESCIGFEILEGVAQNLSLPLPIIVLLNVLILLGHPVYGSEKCFKWVWMKNCTLKFIPWQNFECKFGIIFVPSSENFTSIYIL